MSSVDQADDPTLPTADLGRSEVAVSTVSFGTAAIGGLYTEADPALAQATLDAAWRAGMRYFDTAPHYGAGIAETRLGEFLAGKPRDKVVVSTKVGRLLVPDADGTAPTEGFATAPLRRVLDYSADGVRRSLSESLERTGLDRFDIVLIHDPDNHWDEAISGAYPALERLRSEGVIGAIGVGMNQSAMLTRFVEESDVDCVLMAGRYTLLDRTAEVDLLPACERRGVGIIAGGILNSGILADTSDGARFNYAPAPPDILESARELERLCHAHDVPLIAAALQFPRRNPLITTTLIGQRSPDEVRVNIEHLSTKIPDDLWRDLDAFPAIGLHQ